MTESEMRKAIATGAVVAVLSLLVLFIAVTAVHAKAAKSALSLDLSATSAAELAKRIHHLPELEFGNIPGQLEIKAAEEDSPAAEPTITGIEFTSVLNLGQA